MKYYRPTSEDLLNTPSLVLEMYDEEEKSWTKFVYDSTVHMNIPLDDLRVKYVDSEDFNKLGYELKKIFIKTIEQVKEILPNGTEVMEKVDIWEQEVLTIFKKGSLKPFGSFHPYKPTKNVALREGNVCHSIKNVTELKNILE